MLIFYHAALQQAAQPMEVCQSVDVFIPHLPAAGSPPHGDLAKCGYVHAHTYLQQAAQPMEVRQEQVLALKATLHGGNLGPVRGQREKHVVKAWEGGVRDCRFSNLSDLEDGDQCMRG